MTIISMRPLFAIGVSIIAALLILLSDKKPDLREFWTLLASVVKFLIIISMIPLVLRGNTLEYSLVTFYPGISIAFKVDALGLMFATTASFLWIMTSIYSIGYMRSLNEHAQTRYYACFAITLSAAIGAAFAANVLTLYLFYEIITMVTYPLVSHKETPEAMAGGKKYVTYLLGTSKLFLLPALVLTYTVAGTLDFTSAGVFSATANQTLLILIYILFIAGFAKAAIMPFHGWLPAAMVAPTPVSALLHAVAVVKVGVFSIVRIVLFVFGVGMMKDLHLGYVTALVVSFTIITASVIALTKDNLKARLAYSTVSQLSYIVLGVVLLSPSGITGGIVHITNHAFAKITLFFCAGSIYVASHKTKVSELDGIGRKMPYTMAAFAIGVLGMVGVPPAGGFFTKWYLVIGSMESGSLLILAVLLTSSVLNAVYFVPIVYKAFFKSPAVEAAGGHGEEIEIKENPYIVVPLVIAAVGSLILGLYPEILLIFVRALK
ncbi:MAG: monovalent cation/H+ antiporter subunit D family protein [Thermodesulfobacteriota bacterium]|nr:MAG: monovalent cation/H+ antiporter subunit D family protein [Thermodesulfobacteriota bacterium]